MRVPDLNLNTPYRRGVQVCGGRAGIRSLLDRRQQPLPVGS